MTVLQFIVCSDALKTEIHGLAEELDAHRKARQAEHPRLTLTQMYNVLENLRATSSVLGVGVPSPLRALAGRG